MPYQLLADAVLTLHFAVVSFVVGGLVLVIAGNWRHWRWVNAFWFRVTHLGAIAYIVAEFWLGTTCPLTALEMSLRVKARATTYAGSFIGHWIQRILYYDAPSWVFAIAYSLFGLLIVATWIRYPPRVAANEANNDRAGIRMTADSRELAEIAARTLDHYNRHAGDFRDGTRDHDVSQNIEALLRHITAAPPFTILDFGCGPGRDLGDLARRGHIAIGLDGAARFVEMARTATGCEVWQQDFLKLALPDGHFDGVFANASLFHVPDRELPRVLRELHATLKPGGVLFSSNPRGGNEEGWHGSRYGAYHDLATWRSRVTGAGFLELEHYYRPAGLPREQQPWLASVWRKPKAT